MAKARRADIRCPVVSGFVADSDGDFHRGRKPYIAWTTGARARRTKPPPLASTLVAQLLVFLLCDMLATIWTNIRHEGVAIKNR